MEGRTELKTWGLAALILVFIAVSVFSIQRFIGRFFDMAFEVCIFYVPAAASVAFFLYFWSRPSPRRSG